MENPYQSPQTSEPVEYQMTPSDRTLPETPKELDATWCITRGWKLTCANFKLFFLALTLPLILNGILNNILSSFSRSVDGFEVVRVGNMLIQQYNFGPTSFIVMIISNIVGIWVALGVIRVTLDFLDGKSVSFSTAFSQSHKLVTAVLASILFGIAVGIGFLLLIFPGIYLLTTYSFYMHAIVDKNKGIMESFEYSKQLTRQNKINVFVLGLLSICAGIAGALAIMVGLLWAIPTVYIAFSVAYCCLHHGKTQELEQL